MTATQRTYGKITNRQGTIKGNRTRRQAAEIRKLAFHASLVGNEPADRIDPFTPDPDAKPRTAAGTHPTVFYGIEHWADRRQHWGKVVAKFIDNGQEDMATTYKKFGRDAKARWLACEGGAYKVASYGDPSVHRIDSAQETADNRHQQGEEKPATLMNNVAGVKPQASVTPSPTPLPTKAEGEGLVSSSDNNAEGAIAEQHHNNTEPATKQLTVGNDYKDVTSSTLNAQAKADAIADMQAAGIIADDEPDSEDDSNDRDRLPALDCCEINLRAAFDAFAKNDMATFIELAKQAQEDLERYDDGDKVLRERGWGIVASSLLKPEIVIPDSIESALTPPRRELPSSIPAMTDPAIVIARAFGKAS